ncbi:LysR family transcriptional regulator [Pandoraea thiooxydans]|uniref:LysR family transcriptional regulator n=1 Tax=Pandoraea thiooxydans TaxID=445709 RepID=A0A0G3ET69_9BURK|nr:LysR family transcriptional regulator [Pandoraea thiooxydans]
MHVAELGSFTRAASFLSIAQPVLSRQVRALELEFRQALLERNGRGVTLTEPGKRLLDHGRSLLAQAERIQSDMEDGRDEPSGRLVVALPPSVSSALTTPLVRQFHRQFPKARLCILEGLSAYGQEWLATGRADCAVLYTAATSPAIDLLPILSEALYLISRRSMRDGMVGTPEPVELTTLAECQLVMPSRPHAIRVLVENVMAQVSLKPNVALEIESIPAILNLVRDEGLYAVLSLKALASMGQYDIFDARPIGTPPLQTTLWTATSAQRPRSPLLDQAIPMLRQTLIDTWRDPVTAGAVL